MKKTSIRILIVAAGTGGHILPGIELGREFLSRDQEVIFVSGNRPIEDRVYASSGFSREVIPWPGQSTGLTGAIRRVACMALSPFRAIALLREFRPDAVFSMGGGFGAPILGAARVFGIPVYIHESNAIPGRATRMFEAIARRAFYGFPPSPHANGLVVGTPARPMTLWAPENPPRVTVMGGSQGARRMNGIIREAAELLQLQNLPVMFTILGEQAPDTSNVENVQYVDQPASLLAKSSLVISRSGSGSLAEIAGIGVPSILVPYPFAKDGHQLRNAEIFHSSGASVLIPEAELTPALAASCIRELLADEFRLSKMSAAARTLACPGAASKICDEVEQTLRTSTHPSRTTQIRTGGGVA